MVFSRQPLIYIILVIDQHMNKFLFYDKFITFLYMFLAL